MELQEFITNTIVQITNGVIEAQKELKGSGCLVNPRGLSMEGGEIKKGYGNQFRKLQKVKINVELTVVENTGSKSSIGIAQIIKAGIGSEESSLNNKSTSVEFEVPIAFPVMDEQ